MPQMRGGSPDPQSMLEETQLGLGLRKCSQLHVCGNKREAANVPRGALHPSIPLWLQHWCHFDESLISQSTYLKFLMLVRGHNAWKMQKEKCYRKIPVLLLLVKREHILAQYPEVNPEIESYRQQ